MSIHKRLIQGVIGFLIAFSIFPITFRFFDSLYPVPHRKEFKLQPITEWNKAMNAWFFWWFIVTSSIGISFLIFGLSLIKKDPINFIGWGCIVGSIMLMISTLFLFITQ